MGHCLAKLIYLSWISGGQNTVRCVRRLQNKLGLSQAKLRKTEAEHSIVEKESRNYGEGVKKVLRK